MFAIDHVGFLENVRYARILYLLLTIATFLKMFASDAFYAR